MQKNVCNTEITEYFKYLRVERNLSKKTILAYHYDLHKFFLFLNTQKHLEVKIESITTTHIKDFLLYLHDDLSYKSRTLSRTLSSIKNFFEFAINEKYVDDDPTASIKSPKISKTLPIYLTENELKKLLSTPSTTTNEGIRDRAILSCLIYMGLRLNEIISIDIKDHNSFNNEIRIHGKGSKERIVPINSYAQKAIESYLLHREKSSENSLFLSRLKKRLSGKSIENIVKKYMLLSGIPNDKISPHKLRHSFATLLHEKGVDVIEIQNLLGHRNITSTQIYTHTNSRRLRSATDKLI